MGYYAPLEFLKGISVDEFETTRSILAKISEDDRVLDYTDEEYLSFFFHKDFPNVNEPKYAALKGVIKNGNFMDFLLKSDIIQSQYSADSQHYYTSLCTELKDFLTTGTILSKWAKNKQVFKFDDTFANTLIMTEKVRIPMEAIKHIPVDTFYIDLSDCSSFYPAVGAWVHVRNYPNYCQIATYVLKENLNTKENLIFSVYDLWKYNDDNYFELIKKDLFQNPFEYIWNEKTLQVEKQPEEIRRVDISVLAHQLICYIYSQRPDIEESPITKNTYRPSNVVKNKFSEIQQWDVGIRYGKSIRAYIEKNKESVREKDFLAEGDKEKAKRKSPVPHYRNAHWQIYWTGKGRQVREIKWVAPSFIGGGAKDVVIHTVKS